MRVLVTGGAGYVGAVAVAELLRVGHRVIVLDDLRAGHRNALPDGAVLLRCDIGEPSSYADVLPDIDVCLHFAGLARVAESMQRPDRYFSVNTASTLRLLHALVAAGVDRFVLSSTSAVYGDPAQTPISESAPTRPTNAYGTSKLMIEQALQWLGRLGAMRWASLRYFNACGATRTHGEQHSPETHLIPLALEAAAGRRSHLTIHGSDYDTADGTCVRDFVHVADIAEAHIAVLATLGDCDQHIFNLGTGTGHSVYEVVLAVEAVTGLKVPVEHAPRRAGDPAVLVASNARAYSTFGWRPRHTLDEIIASAWRWHRRRWGLAG